MLRGRDQGLSITNRKPPYLSRVAVAGHQTSAARKKKGGFRLAVEKALIPSPQHHRRWNPRKTVNPFIPVNSPEAFRRLCSRSHVVPLGCVPLCQTGSCFASRKNLRHYSSPCCHQGFSEYLESPHAGAGVTNVCRQRAQGCFHHARCLGFLEGKLRMKAAAGSFVPTFDQGLVASLFCEVAKLPFP